MKSEPYGPPRLSPYTVLVLRDCCARFGLGEMKKIGLVKALDHIVSGMRGFPHCSMLVFSKLSTGVWLATCFSTACSIIQILQAGDDRAADFAPEQHFAMALDDVFEPWRSQCYAGIAVSPRCCLPLGSPGKVLAG